MKNEKFGSMCLFKIYSVVSRQFLLNVSTEHIKENDDEIFKFLKNLLFFL